MRNLIAFMLVSLTVSLAACNTSTIVVGELQEITSLRAIPNHKLDLLFVVDNSPSMLDKQVSLATNFVRMIEVLEKEFHARVRADSGIGVVRFT